ncbi:MAG: DUF4870 domain-containing protein [Pseudomonadota bacterium]|nr:DUF4870 domain-containing protein [Pseudomonadota bacterium]
MSEYENGCDDELEHDSGTTIAMLAEGLFFLNLFLLPVVSFVILALLYFSKRRHESRLARNHLKQAFVAAGITTALFLPILLIVLTSGFKSFALLIAVEIYLVAVVTPFAIVAIFGLLKAMSQQEYRYPLIGKYLIEEE